MTPDELRPILTGYRKQVEQGWSKATSHPSFEGADGSPVGQCGVTSAWLQKRLLEDHGVNATYRMGPLCYALELADRWHCWLEIGLPSDPLIVDLTADQWPGGLYVVCDTFTELLSSGACYSVYGPSYSLADLAENPVQPRLTMLEAALS